MSWGHYGFRPYVPVARRRAQAMLHATRLVKKEKRTLAPVVIEEADGHRDRQRPLLRLTGRGRRRLRKL